jgi:peptidoglycan/LPS O-acetylase OafA/YrhL
LAVEEQFYLIWPMAIALTPSRHLLKLCLVLIAAAVICRCCFLVAGLDPMVTYMLTPSRMDALILGAAAAVISGKWKQLETLGGSGTKALLTGIGLIALGAGLTRLYYTEDPRTIVGGYTVLAVGFALLILASDGRFRSRPATLWRRVLSTGFLGSIGRYSYAMYVFHLPISLSLGSVIQPRLYALGGAYPTIYSITIAALSYVAGWASYHLLEKHFLRLKRYFEPHRDLAHLRAKPS